MCTEFPLPLSTIYIVTSIKERKPQLLQPFLSGYKTLLVIYQFFYCSWSLFCLYLSTDLILKTEYKDDVTLPLSGIEILQITNLLNHLINVVMPCKKADDDVFIAIREKIHVNIILQLIYDPFFVWQMTYEKCHMCTCVCACVCV